MDPQEKTVREYSSAEFTCLSQTDPVWSFFSDHLPSNVEILGNSIIIEKVTIKNQGLYWCEGIDDNGNKFKSIADLNVIGRFIFVT